MTTLSVTFVICLSEYERKVSIKKRKTKGKITKRDTIVEEEYTISMDLKEVEEIPFETSVNYNISLEKPIKSLVIDYEILPRFIYNVEVLFWGPVAKIITKEKIKSVSTISKLKKRWITFTIEHKFLLDINELLLYKNHTITFNMRLERSGNITNVPDSITFFFKTEDVDLKSIFAEVFEYVPSNDVEEKSRAEEDVKLILQEIMCFAFKGEILNILKIPEISHRKKILNLINKYIANKQYDCFNTYMDEGVNVLEILEAKPPTSSKKKGDKKKSKKKLPDRKKRKSSANDMNTFQLEIAGQVLFTDPNMTVFNIPNSSKDMKCGFVMINVKNLISPYQKSILYPIVIKLNKLINVPVEPLIKERFEYLYLTYNICGFSCTTMGKVITNTVHFKNHNIYFLEKKIKAFTQMAQNGYLLVQINGIRKRLVINKSELFGTNPYDKFISVPMRSKKEIEKYSKDDRNDNSFNESVLVAVACFKLNSLLSTFRSFCQPEHCMHPSRCPVPLTRTLENNVDEFSAFTVNTINAHNKETIFYPLSEGMILESELTAVVQMELQRSINTILENLIKQEIFYNRLILVTGHEDLAKYILTNVFTHNSCWIYKDDIVPPNYLTNSESNIDLNNVNIISGFSIDNGDIFIMFLEGNSKWIKNVLWRQIKNEHFKCAKILYNSDHVYKERVYTNLIPYGGVYNITLHSSLKALLDCSKVFTPGYLPEPTRRAFKKIDMILKCKFLNEITMQMLPTKKELLSLDVEWGVPIHWSLSEEE